MLGTSVILSVGLTQVGRDTGSPTFVMGEVPPITEPDTSYSVLPGVQRPGEVVAKVREVTVVHPLDVQVMVPLSAVAGPSIVADLSPFPVGLHFEKVTTTSNDDESVPVTLAQVTLSTANGVAAHVSSKASSPL